MIEKRLELHNTERRICLLVPYVRERTSLAYLFQNIPTNIIRWKHAFSRAGVGARQEHPPGPLLAEKAMANSRRPKEEHHNSELNKFFAREWRQGRRLRLELGRPRIHRVSDALLLQPSDYCFGLEQGRGEMSSPRDVSQSEREQYRVNTICVVIVKSS